MPRLPAAWDGLSILHLTDLHLCGTPDREFYRHVLDVCAGWHPDLVALTGDVVDTLLSLGNSQARADALANILLPDILTYDTSSSAGFLNGRKLTDDVIDAELGLITNNAVTTDCVNNDSTFLSGFPYLGKPN